MIRFNFTLLALCFSRSPSCTSTFSVIDLFFIAPPIALFQKAGKEGVSVIVCFHLMFGNSFTLRTQSQRCQSISEAENYEMSQREQYALSSDTTNTHTFVCLTTSDGFILLMIFFLFCEGICCGFSMS